MNCSVYNLRILRLLPALSAAALTLGLAGSVCADNSFHYNAQPRTVNAGILLLGSASATSPTSPPNTEPYVFYLLSSRKDVLPPGWKIVNPLAPVTATTEIINRWNAITNLPGFGLGYQGPTYILNLPPPKNVYSLGQTIKNYMAPYWEVPLATTSSNDLAKFDILYFKFFGDQPLTASEKEKLRRYVDGGGRLWIEQEGGGSLSGTAGVADNLFFAETIENNGSGLGSSVQADPAHSLLTTPNYLTPAEINALGDVVTHTIANSEVISQPGFSGPLLPVIDQGNIANKPVVVTAQYGAGEVITESMGVADGINDGYFNGATGGLLTGFGHNAGATCIDPNSVIPVTTDISQADIADLKLVVNMIAWTGGYTQQHMNSHQNSVDANADGTSFVRSWSDPFSTPATTTLPLSGAAIYRGTASVGTNNGGLAFVRDANGNLAAYDLNPPNTGTTATYLWRQPVGLYASAPVVATVKSGSAYQPTVFVEMDNGSIVPYGLDGTASAALSGSGTPPTGTTPTPYSAAAVPQAAPSPTIYNGRLYAGTPEGNLYVYDFGSGANFVVRPSATTNLTPLEYVMSSPSVGVVTDTDPRDPNGIPASDIVVAVTTNKMLYVLFLGARNEFASGGVTVHNPKLGGLNAITVQVDSGTWSAYILDALTYPVLLSTSGAPPEVSYIYTIPNNIVTRDPLDSVYSDYDVNLGSVTNTNGGLTRTTAAASAFAAAPSLGSVLSEPVMDNNGNFYFTATNTGVNTTTPPLPDSSTLVCVHDTPNFNDRVMPWRFRIPTSADGAVVDAGSVDYTPLVGYKFVGQPVVDRQGFVYALMCNGAAARIICIDGHRGISLDIATTPVTVPAEIPYVTISQPLAGTPTTDEFGQYPNPIGPNQLQAAKTGHVDLINFSQPGSQLYPNLCEPELVNAQYSYSTGTSTAPPPPPAPINMVPLHTNVVWFTDAIPVNTGLTPTVKPYLSTLSMRGDYLFFGDFTGSLYRVYARPQNDGLVPSTHVVLINAGTKTRSGKPILQRIDTPAYNGNMVGNISGDARTTIINSASGVFAYNSSPMVAVDKNHVVSLDGDGDLRWTADSTSLASSNTATSPGTATSSTQVEFKNPSGLGLVQTSANATDTGSYVMADTGNNRVVQFGRDGRATWELSSFNDTTGLLLPGEPTTLNEPSSVQAWTINPGIGSPITNHYLIADTGNFRVLEITDQFNSDGSHLATASPTLVWVSATHRDGRHYRYTSASVTIDPAQLNGVAGTNNAISFSPTGARYVYTAIANKHVAPQPAAADADSAGGTIVLLDYITKTLSTVPGTIITDYYSSSPATPTTPHTAIKGPRFLALQGGTPTAWPDLLVADGHSAYHLILGTALAGPAATPALAFRFTEADYQNAGQAQVPFVNNGLPASRSTFDFIPGSVQLVGTDLVGGLSYGRYLLSNSYTQGDVGANKFTGEVFEVYYSSTSTPNWQIAGPHTFGLPNNGAALSQPTFAYRLP